MLKLALVLALLQGAPDAPPACGVVGTSCGAGQVWGDDGQCVGYEAFSCDTDTDCEELNGYEVSDAY